MPLKPKQPTTKLGLRPKRSAIVATKTLLKPKQSAIRAAKTFEIITKRPVDKFLHGKITYFLKTFNNIIVSRISRAINKYKCLQVRPAEMREELIAKFQMKFSRAIIDRSIQLWRVTDKSMNVYIQTMVDRLITDEIRSKSREQTYCKDLNIIVEDPDIIINNVGNNPVPMGWLGMNKFSDAESNMLTQELWENVLDNLAKYEPDKLPILRKVMDPDTDVNFSSPSVHSLKMTIKAILKDLR